MTAHSAKVDDSNPASPNSRLLELLCRNFEVFSNRQAEVLRLVRYIDARLAEIDDVAERAREFYFMELRETPDEAALEKVLALFDGSMTDISGNIPEPEKAEALTRTLQEIADLLPEGKAQSYFISAVRASHAAPSGDLLKPSLLVSLVGELEMLVSTCARVCFTANPSALGDGEKKYTWKDVSRFDTLELFKEAIIEEAIESAMRGPLDEWMNIFHKKLKSEEIKLSSSPDSREIVQRRHCIVHNGGVISQQYLSRLSDCNITGEVGDALPVDSGYLHRAADTVYTLGLSLIWSLIIKLKDSTTDLDEMYGKIANWTYRLLQEQRYELLLRLGKEMPLRYLSELPRLIIQVNVWLAHKELGRFEDVRSEIEAFDVRAKSRNFQLAKAALLDRYDEAQEISSSMLNDGELPEALYLSWPLLADLRAHVARLSDPDHNLAESDLDRSDLDSGSQPRG